MHIKMNKALLETNFLVHTLWSKTSLGNKKNTPIAIIEFDLHIYD
jgi:hypothetical protein